MSRYQGDEELDGRGESHAYESVPFMTCGSKSRMGQPAAEVTFLTISYSHQHSLNKGKKEGQRRQLVDSNTQAFSRD